MNPKKPNKDLGAFMELDKVIHERVRLGIMAVLCATPTCSFQELKKTLDVTDGNLSVHLKLLCTHEYIKVHKTFVEGKPQSSYELTKKGRQIFKDYITTIECLISKIPLE